MAGGPTKDTSVDRRVSQLEREVRVLQAALERQTSRMFQHAWPRDVRLAKTVDGGDTYPSSGNTFFIELLDSYFTATPGDQTPTHAERGEVLVGHVVDGSYYAEGTVCFALWSRGLGAAESGEWWLWRAGGSSPDAWAVLTEPLDPTHETATVGSVEALAGGTAPSVGSPKNYLRLAGKVSDFVELKYRTSTASWYVSEVRHQTVTLVLKHSEDGVFLKYDSGNVDLDGCVVASSSIVSSGTEGYETQLDVYPCS